MAKGTKRRITVVLGAVLLVAAAVGTVVFSVNGQKGFSECSGAVGAGWIVPILAALIIGTIVWVLSGQDPRLDDRLDETDSADCPGCGMLVLASWCLCPECGTRLEAGGRVS